VADYAISPDELWNQLVGFMRKAKDMGELAIQYKQFCLKKDVFGEQKYKEGVAVKDQVKAQLEKALAAQVEPGANEPNEMPF
jgi:putative alpha-1,2-mannosidase